MIERSNQQLSVQWNNIGRKTARAVQTKLFNLDEKGNPDEPPLGEEAAIATGAGHIPPGMGGASTFNIVGSATKLSQRMLICVSYSDDAKRYTQSFLIPLPDWRPTGSESRVFELSSEEEPSSRQLCK
jgi:hypothetical protein